jgi:hypothetical protein
MDEGSAILSAQPIGDSSDLDLDWSAARARSVTATGAGGLRPALHQTALLGLSWYEQLAVARFQHWQRVGLLRKTIWKYGSDAVARSLASHQLQVSSLSWAGGFTGAVGFSFREAVSDARQALKEAAAVGAESLVVIPGGRHGHTFRHARRLVADGLKHLADDAAQRRVRLAVLVSPPASCANWSCLSGADDALHLLESVDSPVVGLAAPLACGDAHPALADRWQRLWRRSWIAWTDIDQAAATSEMCAGLSAALERLVRSDFGGVWELRSWARQPVVTPREQRSRCRTVSEALGLPEGGRPLPRLGGRLAAWPEYRR